MPEGRMLKKVISESKKLGALPSDSARLLYTWLIPWLDVEGRHSADPEIIKGHVFPKVKSMTVRKIERLIHELNENRLIILYVCDGETYLQFKKTIQKIDKMREAKSIIPDPAKGRIVEPTHENSGAGHENSSTIKVKSNESKVKSNILGHDKRDRKKELDDFFEKEIWPVWPRKEHKGKAKEKFFALVNTHKIDPQRLKNAVIGYLRVEKSKDTKKWYLMYLKTFFYAGNKKKKIPGTWEEYEKYADPKYEIKPDL